MLTEPNTGSGQVGAGAPHLSEGGVFARQDDHHGDVVSTVRHLQQLDVVLWNVSVPEAGLLIHHLGWAGLTLADVEVGGVHIVFLKFILPLTLKEKSTSTRSHQQQAPPTAQGDLGTLK